MPTNPAELLGGAPWWIGAHHYVPLAFNVQAVTVITATTLAVTYSLAPLQTSDMGAHDALNPANYTLVGPSTVTVVSAAPDPDNIQVIVLTLSSQLSGGTWMLSVANVTTPLGNPLVTPTSRTFSVASTGGPPSPVTPGTVDTEPEDFLRQFLSAALQGQGWTALISALGTGDTTNWNNAEYAFDQLFISSASGDFLDNRLSDDGTERPPGIGLSDQLFRELGISVRTNQLTQEAFLEVLQIFYGTDAVRAYVETSTGAPFALHDGDDLQVLIDGLDAFPVIFHSSDFTLIGQATATEVAVAITRAIQVLGNSKAFAVPMTNPETGISTVRIYSGAIGLRSTVQVTGGKSQNVLLFPEQLPIPNTGTSPGTLTWDVNTVVGANVPQAPPNTMRVYLAAGNSSVDLALVHVGDYVNIFGSGFLPQNRGSFPITNVFVGYDHTGTTLYQWFDVQNFNLTPQTGVTETSLNDVRFYRPLKSTIQAESGRTVVVSQSTADAVDVIIPATTLAVTRTIDTGAYLHVATGLMNPSAPGAWPMTRQGTGVVTVQATNHGLSIGSQIYVDNVVPSLVLPTPIAGNQQSTGVAATTDASPLSQFSLIRQGDQLATAQYSASILLPNTNTSAVDPPVTALQAGGNVGGTSISTCEMLQLTTPAALLSNGGYQWTYNWVATAALPVALERAPIVTPTQGNNLGNAVLVGGLTATYSGPTLAFSTAIYVFSPVAPPTYTPPPVYPGTWAAAPISLTTGACSLTAQLLGNGQLVIAGGAVDPSGAGVNAVATNSAYLTDVNQAVITSGPNLWAARAEAQGVTFTDPEGISTTMVIGGRSLAVAAVNDDDVLALWHLDETTGATAADSGFNSYGYNLTFGGTSSPNSQGKIDYCRDFTTADQGVASGNTTSTNVFLGAFAVEAWVNNVQNGTIGAQQTILCYGGAGGAGNILGELSITYVSAGMVTVNFLWQYGSGPTNVSGSSAPIPYALNYAWHHVGMTKSLNAANAALYDVTLFFDGQPVATFTALTNANNPGASTTLPITWSVVETFTFGGRGPHHTYSATLSPTPIVPGTFTAGISPFSTGVFTDDGAGNLIGGTITGGTINYATGAAVWTDSADRTSENYKLAWTSDDQVDSTNPPQTLSSSVSLAGYTSFTVSFTNNPVGTFNSSVQVWGSTTGPSGPFAMIPAAGTINTSTSGSNTFPSVSVGSYTDIELQWSTTGSNDGFLGPASVFLSAVAIQNFYVAADNTDANPFAGQLDDIRVSSGIPAYFQTGNPSPYARTPQEVYFSWLRGRGDLLTPGNGQLLASSEVLTPPLTETLLITDGVTLVFNAGTGSTLQPGGVTISDGTSTFTDNGSGAFAGGTSFGVTWTGTVSYTTGAIVITFASAPPSGNTMTVTFQGWFKAGKMTLARSGHQATLLPDGRVLVTGGYAYKDGQVNIPTTGQGIWLPTTSAEVFDPRTGVWTQAGFMGTPRADHMAVYLAASNKVLVCGGYQDNVGTPAAPVYDLYDCATGRWTQGIQPIPTTNTSNLTEFTAIPMAFGASTLVWLAGAPGMVFIQGADQVGGGGLEGWQTVTAVPDANHFQYETPAYPQYTTNAGLLTAITPFRAPPAGKIPGPYVWDTTGQTPGITSIQATTGAPLYRGQQYEALTLSANVAATFPNSPGFLVLGFGSSQAVFPVPYLGLFSADQLALDYTFVMPVDVPAGTSVTLIATKGVFVPTTPEAVGSFYLTDSNSGRIAAEGTIENIQGGGLNVDITIAYPGDRGLGGEGLPATGQKFSDKVLVWGSNNLDVDEEDARLGINLQVTGVED